MEATLEPNMRQNTGREDWLQEVKVLPVCFILSREPTASN